MIHGGTSLTQVYYETSLYRLVQGFKVPSSKIREFLHTRKTRISLVLYVYVSYIL